MTSQSVYRFHKTSPIVREGLMALSGWATQPDSTRVIAQFSKHIFWVRETESVVRLVHYGRVVQETKTYVDGGGPLLSSVAAAVDNASDLAANFQIDSASTLVAEVLTRVFDVPLVRDQAGEQVREWEHFQDHYRHVGQWFVGDGTDPDARRWLERELVAELVTWSTGDPRIAAGYADFARQIAVPFAAAGA